MPGAWPGLAVVGEYTLCANTLWCAWGDRQLEVSRDGFQTFVQQVCMTTREWTRGMTNRPQETPLSPTVPYLADRWPFDIADFHRAYRWMSETWSSLLPINSKERGTMMVRSRGVFLAIANGFKLSFSGSTRQMTHWLRRHPPSRKDLTVGGGWPNGWSFQTLEPWQY